jgi:pyruvate, water dikinase
MNFIKYFTDITIHDTPLVGGKNASLGQMVRELSSQGVKVPLGFAITTEAYWYHLEYNKLLDSLHAFMDELSSNFTVTTLQRVGQKVRELITSKPLPKEVEQQIREAYIWLSQYYQQSDLDVAVRSSATAEDLPHASFAGQQDTYLNIRGIEEVLEATRKCMASLFTDRAIVYRIEQGFDHFKVGISVGIQKMVRSDKASAGVIFSLDTDTGFKDAVVITSSYGLGETVVKGLVNPDEFHVHKPTLEKGYKPIIKKYLGNKEIKLIYTDSSKHPLKTVPVEMSYAKKFSLTDDEILELARQTIVIENHYTRLRGSWSPMDVEWAKDGIDEQLYVVQARPETVHATKKRPDLLVRYSLKKSDQPLHVLVTGLSIGKKIAYGRARILKNIHEYASFGEGDILVTQMTDPDWVPIMKKAAAIITDQGGRTCHAAIVSRELGIPAVIGTNQATHVIKEGAFITVDCSQGAVGYVYEGAQEFEVSTVELTHLPHSPVPLMVNIADPDRAYELSFLPVSGVGLARVEFIITNAIKVHPMAVCELERIPDGSVKDLIHSLAYPYGDPRTFFVETLAQGIGTIAAAFYPHPVIVRLSDFKSNEYRNLIGGQFFEPTEENPMLGFRGAVRYCDPAYAPAFALECAALKKVRDEMGLTNVKLLVPFVRTIDEAMCTIDALAKHGLRRGENSLEILMMCEIPSNVLLLDEFSKHFDGFSIGSNDLTQFTLAVDRDSGMLAKCFDERDPAVLKMFQLALDTAHRLGVYMSICGQAPSDFPEVAEFLINHGIDALSLNPDSVIPFLLRQHHSLLP